MPRSTSLLLSALSRDGRSAVFAVLTVRFLLPRLQNEILFAIVLQELIVLSSKYCEIQLNVAAQATHSVSLRTF